MNQASNTFVLSAVALAAAALMAACGGGEANPPPDTTPPTLAITDDVEAATASGPVTFAFTFSEDVGSSFTAEDITVTGGTAGALTKVNATNYTLVVTPAANSSGAIVVTVDAAKFSDAANNANVASSTAQQAYSTIVGTQMSLPVSFDDAGVAYGLIGFGGAEDSTIVDDPTDATNKVARVVRAAGAETFAGTTITGPAQLGFSPPIPLNANNTRMSVRVWSPDAGIPVRLKVEDHTDPGKSVETEATTTVGGQWETLTFNFNNPATGTAAPNFAFTYDKATIFFDFGRASAQAVEKTYYFDDVQMAAGEVEPPPPPPVGEGTVLVSFDEDPPVNLGAFGDAAPSIAEAPAGGTGAALKLDRSGAQNFGGTFFTLPQAVPFAADRKTITARVFATRANARVFLKVEVPGGAATEVAATTGAANTWQTLTWVLDGVNPANNYTVMVFSADTDVANLGAQTYWVDEVTLADAASGEPAPASDIVTFDEESPVVLGAFGDAGPSIAEGPTGGNGAALKLDRSGGLNFGGSFFTLPQAVPFAADRKTITARVFATRANANIFLKVEVPGGAATEVMATTGAANTWQTLTWVLSGVDPANSYTVMVFSADTDVANLGAQTYWIDDVQLSGASGGGGGEGGGGGGGVQSLPITFDDAGVSYVLRGFEGAEDSTLAADPAGGGNMVGKVVRAPGGPWFGGTVVSTGPNESIATIPLTASATTMSMRFFSPAPGVRVRMKIENANDPTKTVETDAVSVGTGWETLVFNFANPGLAPPVTGGPTAPLDVTQTFNKVILFFNVAAAGDAWAGTYYFDDIAFGTP